MPKPSELYGRPWSEEEYLLVLDAYLDLRESPRHRSIPEVQGLARLTGRTPASILMRMENFASVDSGKSDNRRGLVHVPSLGRRLFEEWVVKRDHLKSCTAVLRRAAERNWSERRNLFDMDPVAIPQAFGKYELLDPVGQGSFGSVYSCLNTESNEKRAIKIIQSKRVQERDSLQRFFREIRALKRIDSRHVVTIHEDNLGDEMDFPAFVMDLANTNLTNYANMLFEGSPQRPVFQIAEAVEIIRQMISALEALHPKIIHRDLNPNNILQLPDQRWVLADFGLVKFVGTAALSTSFETQTERGPGTGYYTAPEQYLDLKRTDERVDIYSLGVLVWELFTHSLPPPDPKHSGLPEDLRRVFTKATERNPCDRYSSIEKFRQDFESTNAARLSNLGLEGQE